MTFSCVITAPTRHLMLDILKKSIYRSTFLKSCVVYIYVIVCSLTYFFIKPWGSQFVASHGIVLVELLRKL